MLDKCQPSSASHRARMHGISSVIIGGSLLFEAEIVDCLLKLRRVWTGWADAGKAAALSVAVASTGDSMEI